MKSVKQLAVATILFSSLSTVGMEDETAAILAKLDLAIENCDQYDNGYMSRLQEKIKNLEDSNVALKNELQSKDERNAEVESHLAKVVEELKSVKDDLEDALDSDEINKDKLLQLQREAEAASHQLDELLHEINADHMRMLELEDALGQKAAMEVLFSQKLKQLEKELVEKNSADVLIKKAVVDCQKNNSKNSNQRKKLKLLLQLIDSKTQKMPISFMKKIIEELIA